MSNEQIQDKTLTSSVPAPAGDYLGDSGKREPLKITIPNIKLDAVNAFCEHFDISKSTFIEKCLDSYLLNYTVNPDIRLWHQKLHFFKRKNITKSDIFNILNEKIGNLSCTLCINAIDSPTSARILNNVMIDKYDEEHIYVVTINTYAMNSVSAFWSFPNSGIVEASFDIDRGNSAKLLIPFFHSQIYNSNKFTPASLNFTPDYLEYICYKIPLEYVWQIN